MQKAKKIIAIINIFVLGLTQVFVPVAAAQANDGNLIGPKVSEKQQANAAPQKQVIKKSMVNAARDIKQLTLADMGYSVASAKQPLPVSAQEMETRDFEGDEFVKLMVNNPDRDSFETRVVNTDGEEIPVETRTIDRGGETEVILAGTNQLVPGKFTLEVTDAQGRTSKQDFTWGVLALNTDKAVYKPGESAFVSMAVLDDKGEMECGADVELQIISNKTKIAETYSTKDKNIIINDACHSKAFTLTPDYQTQFTTGVTGEYVMKLTAATLRGSYTISETFWVKEDVAFDIKRTSATRLYPPLDYPMQIEFTANQDFEGTVTETVPESFIVTPSGENTTYDSLKTFYLAGKDPEANVLGASTSSLQMPFDGGYGITQGFGGFLTDNSLRGFYAKYGLAGHDGTDFALPTGTPIYAVDDGNIVHSGPGDYGITIIIQHSWGKSYYGHLSKTNVGSETNVPKGTLIGYSGNTGESTGPHLHFGMKPQEADIENGYAGKIDPMQYLSGGGVMPLALARAVNSTGVLSASTSAEETDIHEQDIPGSSDQAATSPESMMEDRPQQQAVPQPEIKNVAGTFSGTVEATTASTVKAEPFSVLSSEIKDDIADSEMFVTEKVKVLKWKVSLKKGEKTTLGYTYKSPKISPQFYLLGSVKVFNEEKKQIFDEGRKWQLAADAVGTDWYDYSWQYRKPITIDSTKVGVQRDAWCNDTTGVTCTTSWLSRKKILLNNSNATDNLINFPVMVKLNSTRIDYADTLSAGQDLRFVDPSNPNVALNHEIENYDELGNDFIWVEVPLVEAGSSSDYIWMYYNNVSASSPATQLGNTTHETGTWDSNFQAVMHLKENPTGTCSGVNEVCDSTTNANHGNGAGAAFVAGDSITGQVGNAISLDADSYFVQTKNASLDTLTSEMTISLWMTSDTFTVGQFRRAVSRDSTPTQQWFIEHDNGDTTLLMDGGAPTGKTTTEMQVGTWYYVSMSISQSGNISSFYVNGVKEDSSVVGAPAGVVGNVGIGADANGTTSWDGDLDEIRYSNTSRTQSWVEAEYRTMADMMASFGVEEAQTTPVADAWCNDTTGIQCTSSWTTRQKVYLNSGAYGTNLTNFPVAVIVNGSRIDYTKTQIDGDDIRFVEPGSPNVVLSHELEGTWNESGTSVAWVKVPTLTAGNNTNYLWMYYNNASATSGEDATNVWDANYEGIYHMDTNPTTATSPNGCNGATAEICDATANNNDGDSLGTMTSADLVSGKIGNSMDLDGTNDGFQIPDANNSFDVANLTTSAWVRRSAAGTSDQIVGRQNGTGGGDLWQNYISNLENYYYNSTLGTSDNSSAVFDVGSWVYVTYTYNGSTIAFYKNGVLQNTTAATGSLAAQTTNICISGGANDPTLNCTSEFINALLDEVRISGIGRTADWVKAEFFSTDDSMTTFDAEENFNGVTLTDYPVLVSLISDADLSSKAQPDGDDIVFTSSDGNTKISHEIESYASGTLVAWVKISSLTSITDQEIYMYYGNPAAANQQSATSVWDSNYKSVLHLDESGNGAAASWTDSTSNANHSGAGPAGQAPNQTTGIISSGQDFTAATDDYIVFDPVTGFGNLNASQTISFWYKASTNPGVQTFLHATYNSAFTDATQTYFNGTGLLGTGSTYDSPFTYYTSSSVPTAASWRYITYSWDGTTSTFYVDGRRVAQSSTAPFASGAISVMFLGAECSATINCDNFNGQMDESRYAIAARSKDWIATDYTNQNAPSSFYAVGSEETEIYAPTNNELMRHGKFFDGREAEQPFVF